MAIINGYSTLDPKRDLIRFNFSKSFNPIHIGKIGLSEVIEHHTSTIAFQKLQSKKSKGSGAVAASHSSTSHGGTVTTRTKVSNQ